MSVLLTLLRTTYLATVETLEVEEMDRSLLLSASVLLQV